MRKDGDKKAPMHLRSASVLPSRVGRNTWEFRPDTNGIGSARLFPSSPPFGLHFPAVFLQAALSVLIKIAVALKGLSAVITGTVKKVSTRFSL